MSAKKNATKAHSVVAADETPTTEVTTPEVVTAVAPEETADADEIVTPCDSVVPTTVADAVVAVLSAHLPPTTVEAWAGKVVDAIAADRIVTIAGSDDSPVLEIHSEMRYQDRESVRSLAAYFGRKFKVNVNQAVFALLAQS